MPNPLTVATQGKGFLPMLDRGRTIAGRYGLTAGKMYAAVAALITPLNQYACSATIPVTASALAANPTAVKKNFHQGVELAVHGLHHVDYSMLSLERQRDHILQATKIFKQLGISATGFRCPYLRWNEDTLTVLKDSGFTYDSSQALEWDVVGKLSTDSYRRVLDFYGAQSANRYPSLPVWSDNLIRIPYSLPDDEALVDRLHITDVNVMAEIWLAMLAHAYEAGELFTLGLHPERAPLCQAALLAVLDKARSLSPGVWVARLDEIAAWTRALGETTFEIHPEGQDLYHFQIAAPEQATVQFGSTKITGSAQPGTANNQVVFTLRSDLRPLIGLAPGTPAALQRFLRRQGYLVESSANPTDYALYIDRHTFQPEDERPLLAHIKYENGQLVHLSRWPGDARCGLAITGDLDAFTIWDYAKRVLAS